MAAAESNRAPAIASQERVVAQRSHNACAYPRCGVSLVVDPQAGGDLAKSVGKIAHICAASPNGPRYDESMTDKQRGAAENLIFLCGTHHDAIDSQLELHTVQFLRDAKMTHEAACDRAVQHALGQIGFPELEVVCTTVGAMDVSPGAVEVPLSIDEKLRLNELGETTAILVRDGLAQAGRVGEFVEFQGRLSTGFGGRLSARFKAMYFGALSLGLTPDEVFEDIVARAQENSGPIDIPQRRAASLAVVAYFFERCEIFEHEPAAS
jgi:hypothetical protein